MRGPRILMVLAFLCVAGLGFFLFFHKGLGYGEGDLKARSLVIDTEGQPTLGNATGAVHMVIFEEPNCSHCRHYNNQIFPKIRENFIDKQMISYTSIPVSFLPHSMLIAQAWVSVYHQSEVPNSVLFFSYLDAYYRAKALEVENHKDLVWSEAMLVALARKTSSEIDLTILKKHLQNSAFEENIKNNTHLGNHVMQGGLMTPAIFINGIHIKEVSLRALDGAIKTALERNNKSPN